MTPKHLALFLLALGACSSDSGSTGVSGGGADGAGDGGAEDGASADGAEDGAEDGTPASDGEDGAGGGDGAPSEEECGTTLLATVRDFRFDHPDFQNDAFGSDVAHPGLVNTVLGDDHKPVHAAAGATVQTTGPNEFNQWYNDADGVNMPFEVEIPLSPDGTGQFVFDSQAFFPVDGKGFGNEGTDTTGAVRNFAFTTEIHTEFEYKGGEVFTFIGDDDLWLFINRKLAIDLGGLHPKLSQSVNLDAQAAALGITPGSRYAMDIFHAERHTDASTFRIETTIDCLIPVVQ